MSDTVWHTVAGDNPRLGYTIIADSANPIQVTRDAWLEVAKRAGVTAVEIEVICSDLSEHRRRVETRVPDIADFGFPTWNEVLSREYEKLDREHIVIDTAGRMVEDCVQTLRKHLLGNTAEGSR